MAVRDPAIKAKECLTTTSVLHLLMSDYRVDSRVRNETESLKNSGYEIDVFCLKSGDTEKTERRNGVRIARFGTFADHKILHILTAYLGFLYAAMRKNYRLVHAHDFTALPIGYLLSRFKSVPLIYDTHELWSESEHEDYPELMLRLAYRIERYLAKRADRIVTVSNSINTFLQRYFKNSKITTIRNIPSYTFSHQSNILRERFSIPADIPIFIYQGAISKARGVDLILEAVKRIRYDEFRFLFLGSGPYLKEIEHIVHEYDMKSKVILSEAVHQNELLAYLSSGDIGVHAISNTCLNHAYCLPNKLFEYIHAGLGVLCTDLKEMSHLVQEYGIGMLFEDRNPDDLALKLRCLIEHRDQMNRYKSNSRQLRKFLTWDNEYLGLECLYRELLCPETDASS